jgi:Bacterial Ig domain
VPSFDLKVGDVIAFDLGGSLGVNSEGPIGRNIHLAKTTSNLDGRSSFSASVNIDTSSVVQVVSGFKNGWGPDGPINDPNWRGDTISGNFDLHWTVEAPFTFNKANGEGLVVFIEKPITSFGTCDAKVTGGSFAAGGGPYARWYNLDANVLTTSSLPTTSVNANVIAAMRVYVLDQNSATPVALNDAFQIITLGGNVTFDPTVNDTDADGDTLSVTQIATPQYGSLSPTANDNEYEYVADSDTCKATESLTYTVSDGEKTDTAEISIAIDVPLDATADAPDFTYTVGRDENDFSMFVLSVNYSQAYDVYFNVTFPNSSPDGHCDFTSTDPDANALWTSSSVGGKGCEYTVELRVSFQELLAKCGYTQAPAASDATEVTFLQKVTMSTAQTRTDLKRLTYVATTSTDVAVPIVVDNVVTATTENMQVFGAPVDLSLLGQATIAVTDVTQAGDADGAYVYELRGGVVTSIQWPYRLELTSNSLASVFNASTVSIGVDTFCDEGDNHPNNTNCQQVWSFNVSLNSDEACITVNALNQHQVNLSFAVNCSDLFTGECAPSFSATPLAAMEISTPDFCVSVAELDLDSTVTVYAFGDSSTPTSTAAPTSGDSSFFSTLSDAPPASFREENLFVFDATMFAEVEIGVAQDAATVATTTIVKITTVPTSYGAIAVFSVDPDTDQVTKTDSNIIVRNSEESNVPGFGTGTSYHRSRARFALPLNALTINRGGDGVDAAEPFRVDVVVEVTFLEASSLDESDASNSPVMQSLMLKQRGKSQRRPVSLQGGSSTYSAATTGASATASLTSSSSFNPGTPSASTSSSTPLVSNGVIVVVAGVALVAIVAAVVMSRKQKQRPAAVSTVHAQTHGGLLPNVPSQLELVHASYTSSDSTMNHTFVGQPAMTMSASSSSTFI